MSKAIKFPVTRQTNKAAYVETQTHGFEVDLVGARAKRLVLASVKSFLGSLGAVAEQVMGIDESRPAGSRLHAMLTMPSRAMPWS